MHMRRLHVLQNSESGTCYDMHTDQIAPCVLCILDDCAPEIRFFCLRRLHSPLLRGRICARFDQRDAAQVYVYSHSFLISSGYSWKKIYEKEILPFEILFIHRYLNVDHFFFLRFDITVLLYIKNGL